jgi:hypothetical protein
MHLLLWEGLVLDAVLLVQVLLLGSKYSKNGFFSWTFRGIVLEVNL